MPHQCTHCAPLQKEIAISLPKDLVKAVQEAQRYVAGGILEERQHEGYPKSDALAAFKLEGPWDDIVAFDFRCTYCGRSFDIRADTYHGSGGTWGPTPQA